MCTSSVPGELRGESQETPDPAIAAPRGSSPQGGIDLAVAVDLVMLRPGLTSDEAHELLRRQVEATGGELDRVTSDVIDLGTSSLLR